MNTIRVLSFLTVLSLVSTAPRAQGVTYGNRTVLHPAPLLEHGELPGIPGTPASYEPTETSYFFVEPDAARQAAGPVPLVLVLGVLGDVKKSSGLVRAAVMARFLLSNDVLFVSPDHGGEDEVSVGIQRGLDCLADATERWNVDPSRIFLVGHDVGAANATAIQHLLPGGSFAGLFLSSDVHWGALSAWEFRSANVALFSGEDDSSFAETSAAHARMAAEGKNVQFYVGAGLADEAPRQYASTILEELWRAGVPQLARSGLKGSPRLVASELGDERTASRGQAPIVLEHLGSAPSTPVEELLGAALGIPDDEPRQRAQAKAAAVGTFGDRIEEEVRVTFPSPVDFGTAAGLRGTVPTTYVATEDASYFLFVPSTAPRRNRTLVVGVSTTEEGDRWFGPLAGELRARGALFVGAHDAAGPSYSFAERGQKILDCLQDVRRKHSVGEVILYGYCASSGMASAVARALPGQVDGLFLGGGTFPPASERIVSEIELAGGGVYLYTGTLDWARRQVEAAHVLLSASGHSVAFRNVPGAGHEPPQGAELTAAFDWLLR